MKLAHSHSSLSTFDTCPEQMRHLYIVKKFKKSWTPEKDGGIDAHAVLEQRIKLQRPLPSELASAEALVASFERMGSVEAEVSLAVNRDLKPTAFFDKNVWFRGKYDVVLSWPEKARAFIGDWKTGKVRESSEQIERGALLFLRSFSWAKTVAGANIWLQTGKPGTLYKFRREDADHRWAKLIKKMLDIEALDEKVSWERKASPLCPYCPVADCPNYRGG